MIDNINASEDSPANTIADPGMAEAFRRISECRCENRKWLDLGNLGLTSFPQALFELQHLEVLNMGNGYRLTRDNEDFELRVDRAGNGTPNLVSDVPAAMGQLRSLRRVCASRLGLRRVGGIAACRNLERLDLSQCKELANVDGLEGLPHLTDLQLLGCSNLTNLHGLKGLTALANLNLTGCSQLVNLDGLEELTSLTCLDLNRCRQLANLDGLKRLRNLARLNMQGYLPVNLDGLKGLTGLAVLDLSGCEQLTSVDALKGLTNLHILDLGECTGLVNVDGLRDLVHLHTLHLWGCRQLANVESLKGLISLVTLTLDGCNLHRFPAFTLSLPSLRSLSLYGCKLDDVPTELLGRAVGPNSNCLHAVRAYLGSERGQPLSPGRPDTVENRPCAANESAPIGIPVRQTREQGEPLNSPTRTTDSFTYGRTSSAALRDTLVRMVQKKELDACAALCRSRKEEILADFSDWIRMPADVAKDIRAALNYAEGLFIVAELLQSLGSDRPMSLMQPDESALLIRLIEAANKPDSFELMALCYISQADVKKHFAAWKRRWRGTLDDTAAATRYGEALVAAAQCLAKFGDESLMTLLCEGQGENLIETWPQELDKAKALLSGGKWQAAIDVLQATLAKRKQFRFGSAVAALMPATYGMLGLAYVELGDLAQGAECLRHAVAVCEEFGRTQEAEAYANDLRAVEKASSRGRPI